MNLNTGEYRIIDSMLPEQVGAERGINSNSERKTGLQNRDISNSKKERTDVGISL